MCVDCFDGDTVQCPACNRVQPEHECVMGTLGSLVHFRCRGCGMDFSREVQAEPVAEQEVA